MAHTKSAVKRSKTSAIKRDANRATKGEIASMRKKFLAAVEEGDKGKSAELCRVYASILDKAAKRGVIQANNASRRKARAAAKVAGIKSA
jgi:small subunit ribosomal protein S20